MHQVILVLGFGFPEGAGRRDFGHDLAGPQARRIDVGDGVLGDAFLLIAGIEDRRAVAAAEVVALPVARGRIVDLEEELEQLAIVDDGRVERDLDRFRVRAVVAVGGIRDVAAGVADAGRDHAGLPANQVLHAPEAATGENGAFGRHGFKVLAGENIKHRERPARDRHGRWRSLKHVRYSP